MPCSGLPSPRGCARLCWLTAHPSDACLPHALALVHRQGELGPHERRRVHPTHPRGHRCSPPWTRPIALCRPFLQTRRRLCSPTGGCRSRQHSTPRSLDFRRLAEVHRLVRQPRSPSAGHSSAAPSSLVRPRTDLLWRCLLCCVSVCVCCLGFTSPRGRLHWHPHPFIGIKRVGRQRFANTWCLSVLL